MDTKLHRCRILSTRDLKQIHILQNYLPPAQKTLCFSLQSALFCKLSKSIILRITVPNVSSEVQGWQTVEMLYCIFLKKFPYHINLVLFLFPPLKRLFFNNPPLKRLFFNNPPLKRLFLDNPPLNLIRVALEKKLQLLFKTI